MVENRRVYFFLTILSFLVTIFFGVTYLFTENTNVLLFTLLSLLISSILYTFHHLKYFIIHLIFYLTIFIFLISRPTIDYFQNGILDTYQSDVYQMSFLLLIVSILGLLIGGFLVPRREPKIDIQSLESTNMIENIRKISLGIFLVSYPFYLIRLVERFIYRLSHDYYDYYANFDSQLPYVAYILSTFMVYAMCIYLATKPKKLPSTLVLVAFVFANAINLFIGTRNPFILSVIFAFLYYFIRNQTEKGLWLGFKEKLAISIGIPITMLGMGMLNYIRDDVAVNKTGIFDLLLDFIYKQGTSFGVLARGYLYESNLPVREFRNYSFSSIIEYITQGSIGMLFGGKPFESSGNSIELALHSDRYHHTLSYIVMPEDYLKGHGLGSSYIMELYTDFGLIGLFLFSILLGALFILMMRSAYSSRVLLFGMTLFVLNNLFFMPRSHFFESFFNLFTIQFWAIVFVIFIGAALFNKHITHLAKGRGEG